MSNVSRVATSQRYDTLLQAMQQNKAALADAEAAIATGLKRDVFADAAGQTGLSLDLRNKKDVADTYLVANAVTAERQKSAAMLLASLGEQVLSVRNLLAQGDSWRSNPSIVQDSAKAALENVVTALNTSFGGIYLFSGRATDTAPYVSDGNGGYVYQGDTAGNFTAPMADGHLVTVAPRGDAPALADTIALLGRLANTDLSTMTFDDAQAMFDGAIAALSKGYDGITLLEGTHGNNQLRLSDMMDTQRALSVSYNNTIVNIEGVDPEEAAVRLKAAQIQLESTYAVTAQLSSLSLLKYL